MKYDILEPYKEFLYDQLTANTCKKILFLHGEITPGSRDINRVEELSLEYLQKELPQRFRTKMSSALAKNALRLFGECLPQSLQMPKRILQRREPEKRNYTKKPGKSNSFEDYYA